MITPAELSLSVGAEMVRSDGSQSVSALTGARSWELEMVSEPSSWIELSELMSARTSELRVRTSLTEVTSRVAEAGAKLMPSKTEKEKLISPWKSGFGVKTHPSVALPEMEPVFATRLTTERSVRSLSTSETPARS